MFGWIRREHHDEVVRAKDDLIRSLQVQNVVLAARLDQPIVVTVKLPDELVLLQPAVVRRRKPQDPDSPAKPVEVDWASVDENNLAQIAQIAAEELGPHHTPIQLADCVARIKRHARTARVERTRRSQESGMVGAVDRTQTPARIQQMIADAESGE